MIHQSVSGHIFSFFFLILWRQFDFLIITQGWMTIIEIYCGGGRGCNQSKDSDNEKNGRDEIGNMSRYDKFPKL